MPKISVSKITLLIYYKKKDLSGCLSTYIDKLSNSNGDSINSIINIRFFAKSKRSNICRVFS
ncbi:hypothetical protein D5K91_08455, partial [Arcobacter butzleri]